MSAIVHVFGRPTQEPAMQKAQNSGTEYCNLSIATSQRGQNGDEPLYFECHFNKFLAQRLVKAKVTTKSCLHVYGDLELHPFIHQNGANAGKPGINAKLNVKDWQFLPSSRPENASGANGGYAQNGNAQQYNQGGAAPQGGGYPNQGMPNGGYSGAPNGGYPNMPAANMGAGVPAQPGYQTPNQAPPNYNGMPAGNGYGNNGFTNVPENQAGQLPFS
ncbi:single-stranded DNA-binding protein [Clostridium sp. C105KSO13]|uniref:single-stranded DNA-binding protein n=1 Tax=Clostridium sp. C105KSO13 TaxID=1776045 RepID=UPI0007408772|nr:single-stranded DNA-binding protein [Clostridium sp. C105KSO13]CUX25485.1 Single-stranded DNA-binding protein [Clostridium sp. C105KSO13]